ncbi:zinc ABC transporter substrate-binding protein [Sneathiella chinensis]|uniref:High-affinity zinc uptake system protein ZnuA n=1 Tax=Sneathiella chinensis TaxID=349750 RepID=A0ABQ5U504_9PROT|nr:zinc ABC transporter substrate-binding protein [Sneathiella chinensis]GLQ06923.1 zinc ABC transporter substrate-binding protein [Sneathiella chinensis]
MKKILLSLAFLGLSLMPARAAETAGVVTTIAPLHSLVQGVMGDTGQADLIVRGNNSPHGFQLKPSQIRALREARVIFYIGEGLESFLGKAFRTLPPEVSRVGMMDAEGVEILSIRDSGGWEAHQHHAHEHHQEEGHGHDHDHDKGHDKDHDDHKGHDDHKDHDDHKGHDDHAYTDDHHIWLSPDNGVAMVGAITRALSRLYPENTAVFEKNAAEQVALIRAAEETIRQKLVPVREVPFIVFHDAYQYFERHFGLTAVGSILLEPEELPSISRVQEIRRRITESGAVCIFREPQFSDKLVSTVAEGLPVRLGTLDPIGLDQAEGAGLYQAILTDMADQATGCLQ